MTWAKSRTNDANKIISIATNMFKKQFKQLDTTGEYSSNSPRFIYTLETLLTTINDDSNLLVNLMENSSSSFSICQVSQEYHDFGQHSTFHQRSQSNQMIVPTETTSAKTNGTENQITKEDACIAQVGMTMGQLLAVTTAVNDRDTSRFSLTKHQMQQ